MSQPAVTLQVTSKGKWTFQILDEAHRVMLSVFPIIPFIELRFIETVFGDDFLLHVKLSLFVNYKPNLIQFGGAQSSPHGDNPSGATTTLPSRSLSHAAHQLKVLSPIMA